ncbi:uncharacterized protein SPSK_02689 [Sporothrix schenckii 1099-18]|uniref:Uncharacterized protein n=2 Tax=Sporothrix schenckii TaxID=29908 RepID=U7PMX6_SPOS1|nr:uncharacterized protein SPSK_02689 [Sporothrix schenckii 1099-18]ERS96968.1 hypothetical protein HMPREF1624_06295 [Sporothrix schenckii ATCC 58251]KJR86158.1 hypothetical protein SPSK_02689 [Sporothrix schenckii 1099-18]
MSAPSVALVVALALLTADGVIELGFITSMVSYLHAGAPSGTLVVNTPPGTAPGQASTYEIKGKPLGMLVNQGHTSNGAAGSAIVLIGIVGALALYARAKLPGRPLTKFLYGAWMVFQVPTFLLTLSALGYTFAVTNKHRGQTIDQTVAYATQPGPYALDQWTPQNWFAAVLDQLDLADPAVAADLARHLRIMRGWQYNLILLFLVQLAETVLALVDWWAWRQNGGHQGHLQAAGPANEKHYVSQGDYNDGTNHGHGVNYSQLQYENQAYADESKNINQHGGYSNGANTQAQQYV